MSRSELASLLLELLQQETGETFNDLPGGISDATNLRDELKLDSVDMVSLLLHVENQLSISVETQELGAVETVGHLLDLLEKKVAPEKNAAAMTPLAA